MASTEALTTLPTAPSSMVTTEDPGKPQDETEEQYRTVLLVIYSVVLLCGSVSLSLMMHVLKSNSSSATSITVLNLIFAHFIFLVTVPFRIYYYATNHWSLGKHWCKIVSSMIHIHMYMSFVLYVIILITRLLTFYNKATHIAAIQRIHAFIVSALVWIVVLSVVPLVVHFSYGGGMNKSNETNVCFQFGKYINLAKEFNYVASTFIIVVAVVLTCLQANVLRVLYRKHRQRCAFHQEFGAQIKSLCFALIMVFCFIPYHIFRLHYLEDINLQNVNEVFLSLTTFNCLDMLTFLGRRTFHICLPGRCM